MHSQSTIDRHRSEIQKRISQLEGKLLERGNHVQAIKPYAHARENGREKQDITQHSRTAELRNNLRPAQRLMLREEPFEEDKQNRRDEFRLQSNTYNLRGSGTQKDANKDLYEMMRTILEGQKHIEKELLELKNDYLRDSSRRNRVEDTGHFQPNSTAPRKQVDNTFRGQQGLEEKCLPANNISYFDPEKPPAEKMHNQVSLEQNKTVGAPELICKPTNSRARSNTMNKSRAGIVRKNCPDKFEELINLVKNQRSKKQRFIVQEEAKSKIWKQVEVRIRESEKEYKDTIHRNNKHEHEHLISTYELQKKLKDDLTAKVFQQCNSCIYK